MSIPKLFAACKQGNVANVRHAMEDGIDVHIQSTHHLARRITTRDNDRMSPLLYACKSGRLELVQELVSAGVDVNLADEAGWTGLMYAIESKNELLVTWLLGHGANVFCRNDYGDTCLHIASKTKRIHIIQVLLDFGLSDWVNMPNIMGDTAFFTSNEHVLRLLAGYGANFQLRSKHGIGVAWHCLFYNNEAAFQVLLDHGYSTEGLESNAMVQRMLASKNATAI